MNSFNDIVITGVGLVGPYGDNEESLAEALLGKKTCFGKCSTYEAPYQVGEVKGFRLSNYIKNPRAERAPRISQFALAAAALAMKQARLDGNRVAGESTAIVYGTGNGPAVSSQRSLDAIVGENTVGVEPVVFQESVFNAPASAVSIQFNIKGPIVVLPMGWTSGLHVVKQACDLLRRQVVERVLVIAADELAEATHQALSKLGFVSPNDGGREAMLPFDARANGAIFSEGAAAMMIERASTAAERGVKPRARVKGCAIGGDAVAPASSTSSEPIVRTMRRALAQAGKEPWEIDHVFAGTMATRQTDRVELEALRELFSTRKEPCPVTSIKSVVGEAVGPSGLVSMTGGLIEFASGRLFANNHVTLQDFTEIEFPLHRREQTVRCILVNAIGLSNISASVVLEAVA